MKIHYNEHQVERESSTGKTHRHGTIIIYEKFGPPLNFLRVNLDYNWGRRQKSQVSIQTIGTWNRNTEQVELTSILKYLKLYW